MNPLHLFTHWPVTCIILSPLLGALVLAALPQRQENWIRRISAAATLLPLLLAF